MKFAYDRATQVVALRPTDAQTQMITVQLPVRGAVEVLSHLRRIEQVFSLLPRPTVIALRSALAEVLVDMEATQRLDPAFASSSYSEEP